MQITALVNKHTAIDTNGVVVAYLRAGETYPQPGVPICDYVMRQLLESEEACLAGEFGQMEPVENKALKVSPSGQVHTGEICGVIIKSGKMAGKQCQEPRGRCRKRGHNARSTNGRA